LRAARAQSTLRAQLLQSAWRVVRPTAAL